MVKDSMNQVKDKITDLAHKVAEQISPKAIEEDIKSAASAIKEVAQEAKDKLFGIDKDFHTSGGGGDLEKPIAKYQEKKDPGPKL